MIHGVGIDIVSLARMRSLCKRHARRLGDGLFTENELHVAGLRRCIDSLELSDESVAYLAGCFAAKEASVKAMGLGPAGFNWTDLDVSLSSGIEITLRGRARDEAVRKKIGSLAGVCSYTDHHALALVVGESAS